MSFFQTSHKRAASAAGRLILLLALLGGSLSAPAQIDFAPANDIFANRTDLGSVDTVEVPVSTFRSSTEPGDPVFGSVWWQWTAPRDGWWEVQNLLPWDEDGDRVNTTPPIHVFRGDGLGTLITAPDGGVRLPRSDHDSRLFRAEAGLRYQISTGIGFLLRPVSPASNTSLATRVPLTPEGENIWRGQGWATHVTAPPFVAPGGSSFRSPLFWEWTCPADGTYRLLNEDGAPSSIGWFKGAEFQLAPHSFPAQAGETYVLVSGTEFDDVIRHEFRLYRTQPSGPAQGAPYEIRGPLPRTVTPPADAPHRPDLEWTWYCQQNGWVEFEGAGLKPSVVANRFGSLPAAGQAEVIFRNGKYSFWASPGSYTFHVNGWQWPAPGSFVLRQGTMARPNHDSFAHAASLGTGRTATFAGTAFGATRELGDPPVTPGQFLKPTVWHTWRPDLGNGWAEVFVPEGEYGATLRVYTGTDPAFLTEIPVTRVDGDDFAPARWRFPGDYGYTTYHLCLSGVVKDYVLRAWTIHAGFYAPRHPETAVTELPGTVVSEGAGLSTFGDGVFRSVWFLWTAPADGWIHWMMSGPMREISRGPDFAHRQNLDDQPGYDGEFFPVTAGTSYWFECGPKDWNSENTPIQRLRVVFSETETPLPGDDPGHPVSLGSQIPLATRCLLSSATVTDAERNWVSASSRATLGHAAWYSWTAPAGVDGCDVDTGYTACEVFADAPGGPRIGASDPRLGYPQLFFRPDAGRTYFFMLHSTNEPLVALFAPLTLLPYDVRPAPNDDFANAVVVPKPAPSGGVILQPTGSFISSTGDGRARHTLSAEAGEPLADPSRPAANRSAWWKWTAPATGIFRVNFPDLGWNGIGEVENPQTRSFVFAAYKNSPTLGGLVRLPGILAQQRQRNSLVSPPPGKAFTFQAEMDQVYLLQLASPDEYGGVSMKISQGGDAYDTWALALPGLPPAAAAPDANPSGDGMDNLLKFCLGLNPVLSLAEDPAKNRAPVATVSPEGSALHYTFSSNRFNTGDQLPFPPNGSPALADTARLVAERSTDLENWTLVTDAESLGGDRWRVALPINGTMEKHFVRLRAEWVIPSNRVIFPVIPR